MSKKVYVGCNLPPSLNDQFERVREAESKRIMVKLAKSDLLLKALEIGLQNMMAGLKGK